MQNRCNILLAYQGGLEVVSIALSESTGLQLWHWCVIWLPWKRNNSPLSQQVRVKRGTMDVWAQGPRLNGDHIDLSMAAVQCWPSKAQGVESESGAGVSSLHSQHDTVGQLVSFSSVLMCTKEGFLMTISQRERESERKRDREKEKIITPALRSAQNVMVGHPQ